MSNIDKNLQCDLEISWSVIPESVDFVSQLKSTLKRLNEYMNQEMEYSDPVILVANGDEFAKAKEAGMSDFDAAVKAGLLEYRMPALIPKRTNTG